MSLLPTYPEFAPLTLDMAREISPHLVKSPDGISEYSFAGFYLFRHRYSYKISRQNDFIVLSGTQNGKSFFITPCCKTDTATIRDLAKNHDYWKLISPTFIKENSRLFSENSLTLIEDRDNYDYLYAREDLAKLQGKKFHKKKNHINAFELANPDFSTKPLTLETREHARQVLEAWKEQQANPEQTDYKAAHEILDLIDKFELSGLVLYVKSTPVAWTLAELVADGTMAAVHFEKARLEYRGAFQYINYIYAQSLPESITLINREQDLGDEGLRQAKMSYRPIDFVEKYKIEDLTPVHR